MKRRHTIFCLLIFLVHTMSAQGYFTLYQYFETDSAARPGYESIVERTTTNRTLGRRDVTEVKTVETFYDDSGKPFLEERSGNVGSESQLEFHYDSLSGRLNYILQTTRTTKHEAFARYDKQGRLAETVLCPEGKPCNSRIYAFDEDNTERVYVPRQTIELQMNKDKPGTIFGISANNKEKNELVRERFFDPEGKLEEIRNYVNDTFSTGWILEYDQSGRKSNAWAYNSGEKKLGAEFQYNADGLLASEAVFLWVLGSKLELHPEPDITHCEYDERGRIVRTESKKEHYSKIREYTYNER
jgi:hypothetical protein